MWYSVSLIHLGKLQVAADSAQLRNRTSENAATLYFWEGCVSLQYCHCMQLQLQLHATQGNSLLNIFFFRRSRSTDTTDTAFDWNHFWCLIFPRFALTSKGHVSLASEYKCLHHSHPFCMFFFSIIRWPAPGVYPGVPCIADLPLTVDPALYTHNCILCKQLYFVHKT